MYRFENIIGNEHIVRAFRASLKHERIAHALCISGKPGTGRKLIAYAFAKALQCENRRDSQACEVCASCVSLEAGTHPDIFSIRSEKSSVGVDIVRERIVAEMSNRPYRYAYKVFVVEEASALTIQAQNAILKTLEEPCGYGVIMLVAEKADSLLPTIRSRCVAYATRPVGSAQIADYLTQNADVSPVDALKFAQLSSGSIGRAMQLATDEEFCAIRDYTALLAENLGSFGVVETFSQTKELERYKHRIADVLDILCIKYRDELVESEADEAKRFLLDKLSAIDKARARLRFNGNFQLVMDSLLLSLRKSREIKNV